MDITAASLSLTGSLPAGTNNIGDVDVLTLPSLPAGTNNIGDVDVLSLPSLPAGSNNIGTVDTELPAAAALSDAFANPTAPAVGACHMYWDSGSAIWRRANDVSQADGNTNHVPAAGIMLYDTTTTAIRAVRSLRAVGDGQAGETTLPAGIKIYNGSTFDHLRQANTAANTTGTGLLGCHNLAFDGTNYQKYRTVYGTHANAWNAAVTGAGGASTAVDVQFADVVSVFGNTSGASTITVQYSQDNSNYYDSGTTIAANGDFGISFAYGARYVRLKSSANVTATVTISAKV